MRLGVTRTVACATRDISMPGFGAIVNAAEEVLQSSGYTLLLATTDERKERELGLLRIFQQRRVDAIIMTTSSEDDAELSKQIKQLDIPVVLLDRENPQGTRRGDARPSQRHPRRDGVSARAWPHPHCIADRQAVDPACPRANCGFQGGIGAFGQASQPGNRPAPAAFSAEFGFREASSLLSSATPPTAVIAGGMAMLPGVLQADPRPGADHSGRYFDDRGCRQRSRCTHDTGRHCGPLERHR